MAIATLIGLGCVAISLWLYPHTSQVVDERVYVQQSIAIESGRLTMPAGTSPFHTSFFTHPNAAGESVFKYQPLYPAILALTRITTGTDRTSVGLIATIAAFAVGCLAHELFSRRRVTLLSVVAFGASPMFIVAGSARLAYGLSLALVVGSAALFLRAWRRPTPFAFIAAGACFGLAFFNRPYDALLMMVPVGGWILIRDRPSIRSLAGKTCWFGLGWSPILAAMFWINWRTTGDAFTLSYSFVGPLDKLGFGPRLDIHDGNPFDFTVGRSLLAFRNGTNALWRWSAAGPLGLIAFGWAAWTMRRRGGGLLILLAISAPLGYRVVWGEWNGYVRLGVINSLGPMYWLTVVVPIALSVGIIGDRLVNQRPRMSIGLMLAALVASGVLVRPAIVRVLDSRIGVQQQVDLVDAYARQAATDRRQIVLVTEGDNLLYRDLLYNRPDFSNRVVGALDRPGELGALFERFPNAELIIRRRDYVLAGGSEIATERDELGFERSTRSLTLQRTVGTSVDVTLDIVNPAPGAVIYTRTEQGVEQWGPATSTVLVRLTGSALALNGRVSSPMQWGVEPATKGLVCIGVMTAPDTPGFGRDETCFDVSRNPRGDTSVIWPGRDSTVFNFGAKPMLAADISARPVLNSVSPAPN